ncbi:MAG: 50S ribosomal protein L24e [Candidatus Aenigmatarchaeota archaeon]
MPKCSFCSQNIVEGTGKLVVEKNGKMFWFCKSKCEKNLMKLGRDPRNFKWATKKNKEI